MRMIKIANLVSVVLMTGCSVFPQYTKPVIKTAETWQASMPHDGNVANLMDWWAQFNDPALNQMLQAAQADSPTLDKAMANIKSARANVTTAQAQALPSITGSASANRSKGSSGSVNAGSSAGGATTTITGALDAAWEIDLFGGIKFSKQAAQARLEAKQADWHLARVSLAAEVASDYVSYRACELSVAAYVKALDSKKETLRLTAILANAGFSAPADAALAEASMRASESTLIAQKTQCDVTVKSLVALTNLPEQNLRALLANQAGIPKPAQLNISSVPADLLTQRPDLVMDERNLAAASADVGIATADRYPTFSLLGSIGRRRIDSSGVSVSSNTWSFGPSISVPIFDAGQRKAEVTKAEANYEIALANYQQDVRSAVKEVEQALVNLESANQREKAERISQEQYAKYYQAAEINWRAGGVSLLSLEDARRQMINAEINQINQQQNQVQYWIALYKALGGGWQEKQATSPKNNTENEAK
ncbi:MAG: efflux transporter outer membrane subunit [Methylophilus sp.]|nr:efflux transporter outer membrane subunit [Methylophilus sp.]